MVFGVLKCAEQCTSISRDFIFLKVNSCNNIKHYISILAYLYDKYYIKLLDICSTTTLSRDPKQGITIYIEKKEKKKKKRKKEKEGS
jgi:hypothetical protein